MPSILDMLAEAAGKDLTSPPILPEAAIERLREALPRYTRQNPFKVGDLVTPVADSDLRWAGNPHLVVEVFDPVRTIVDLDSSSNRPLDMRVITINPQGSISAFYVENACFETYTAPGD